MGQSSFTDNHINSWRCRKEWGGGEMGQSSVAVEQGHPSSLLETGPPQIYKHAESIFILKKAEAKTTKQPSPQQAGARTCLWNGRHLASHCWKTKQWVSAVTPPNVQRRSTTKCCPLQAEERKHCAGASGRALEPMSISDPRHGTLCITLLCCLSLVSVQQKWTLSKAQKHGGKSCS